MADGRRPAIEVTEKIAGFIADLIPDGATMQMGIGAIPDAVLKYLFNKKDLGVHTELFSDGVIDLVEAGVVTNARKSHPSREDRRRVHHRHPTLVSMGGRQPVDRAAPAPNTSTIPS